MERTQQTQERTTTNNKQQGKERRGSFGLSPSLLFLPDLKKNTINLKNKQIYREGTKIKIIKNQCVRQINKLNI